MAQDPNWAVVFSYFVDPHSKNGSTQLKIGKKAELTDKNLSSLIRTFLVCHFYVHLFKKVFLKLFLKHISHFQSL